jgi:hypothetical protein
MRAYRSPLTLEEVALDEPGARLDPGGIQRDTSSGLKNLWFPRGYGRRL